MGSSDTKSRSTGLTTEMREAQKSLLDAEERILSAEYSTKVCEISLLQISGKKTKYLE